MQRGIVDRPRNALDYAHNVHCRYDQLNEVARKNPRPLNPNFIFGDRYLNYLEAAYLAFREYMNMPKKEFKSVDFKGFINHKLTESERENFLSWDVEDDDVWLLFTQLLTEGYKITSTFNKSNSTYNVVLYCQDADSPNAGYGLSAYHPNWYQAVRAAMFKHEFIFDRKWIVDGAVSNDQNWG